MAEEEKKKFDFIIVTRTPWNEIPRSRHQFTHALAQQYSCLFIESNTISERGKIQLKKIHNRLSILSVSWFFPYKIRYRIPFLSNLYYRMLKRELDKICITEDAVCITFDHTSVAFNKEFRKSVYYATDDHTRRGAKKLNLFISGQWKQEAMLNDTCGMIMVTAGDLMRKFSPWSNKLMLLPLAGPTIGQPPEPKKTQELIRVAFLAVFNRQRLPMDLLKSLGQNNTFEFICIGPAKEDFRQEFNDNKRMNFVGPLTGDALYEMLRTCDVGIAPYRIDTANSGVTPSKLWQYLACGLPVVATRLPSMSEMQIDDTLVCLSNDNLNFTQLITESVARDSDTLRMARYRWSQEQTWEARITTFVEVCKKIRFLA